MIDLTRPLSGAAWQHHADALQHLARLTRDVHSWRPAPLAMSCATASPHPSPDAHDRKTMPEAPLDRWDTTLGQAVVELRAALDALVRSYADLATLTAAQQQRLRFPIVAAYDRWKATGLRTLAGVPVPVQDQIRGLQPFSRAEHERDHHPLALLAHLDAPCAPGGPRRGTTSAPAEPPEPRLALPAGQTAAAERLVVATPAGPAPALATLEALAISVALILTHIGGETGRAVRAVRAG